MAMSTCPKCGFNTFEAEVKEIISYAFKLNFIQCASCGCVVGVMPYYDPGHLGHEAEKKLTDLKNMLTRIEQYVAHMVR